MKYLHRLKKTEYCEGANIAFVNAKAHLDVAILCSSNNHHGIAASHLIIACEELCKASILRIKFLIPNLKVSDLNKYFSDHRVKHDRIAEILVVLCGFEEDKVNDEPLKSDVSSFNNVILSGLILFAIIIVLLSKEPNNDTSMTPEEMRVRGFYVDLKDDKTWKTPNDFFTKEQFEEHLTSVLAIFEIVESKLLNKIPKSNDLESMARELGYIKDNLEHSFPEVIT